MASKKRSQRELKIEVLTRVIVHMDFQMNSLKGFDEPLRSTFGKIKKQIENRRSKLIRSEKQTANS